MNYPIDLKQEKFIVSYYQYFAKYESSKNAIFKVIHIFFAK